MKLQLSFNFIKEHSLYVILTSVVSLTTALLSSILFSASFGNDTFVRMVWLIAIFVLVETFFIVSLQAWDGLCDLIFTPKALPPSGTLKEETVVEEETQKEVEVQKSLPAVQTEEEHAQACLRTEEEADEKRGKILENIYSYIKDKLSDYFKMEDINLTTWSARSDSGRNYSFHCPSCLMEQPGTRRRHPVATRSSWTSHTLVMKPVSSCIRESVRNWKRNARVLPVS